MRRAVQNRTRRILTGWLFACVMAGGLGHGLCLPLDRIKLPPGFQISVYSDKVENARSLCLGEKGTVFVGTRYAGRVYALTDTNRDGYAESPYVLAQGLRQPNGVAFRKGALYVAEVNRILRFDQIETRLPNPPAPATIVSNLPARGGHDWRYIGFGPSGDLFVSIGAPCNACASESLFATLCRVGPNGNLTIHSRGVRNSMGFDWHPQTGDLWFTDNGRDGMGDNRPPDELNCAGRAGLDFGYPYCHGRAILDPNLRSNRTCAGFEAPALELPAHVASLGMRFYTGRAFPEKYRGRVFIAEHGSWNRSQPIGYRISTAQIKDGKATGYAVFAEGFLQGSTAWGRPVDILAMPDGSLLVSDDHAGAIYRITYTEP